MCSTKELGMTKLLKEEECALSQAGQTYGAFGCAQSYFYNAKLHQTKYMVVHKVSGRDQ